MLKSPFTLVLSFDLCWWWQKEGWKEGKWRLILNLLKFNPWNSHDDGRDEVKKRLKRNCFTGELWVKYKFPKLSKVQQSLLANLLIAILSEVFQCLLTSFWNLKSERANWIIQYGQLLHAMASQLSSLQVQHPSEISLTLRANWIIHYRQLLHVMASRLDAYVAIARYSGGAVAIKKSTILHMLLSSEGLLQL